jgi:hypothetical protein
MKGVSKMNSSLRIALKEWDLVIAELLAGRQAILLRKGGILEANNEFELEQRRFLFYPTFVHQDPRMVKAGKRGEIRGMASEPGEVEIRGYGEVAKILEVPAVGGRERVDRLRDLHVWDEPLVDMRFAYRAEKPLYVVVVRAFLLGEAVRMENTLAYAGCRSWVPLERDIDVSAARQAMEEEALQGVVRRIEETLR